MKQPDKDSLQERMLAAEVALDAALREKFDVDSCGVLTDCLAALSDLVLDEDETLPVFIEDDSTPTAKVLVMYDVAFACWMNDESAVELSGDVILNHAARLRLNRQHRESVLKFTRMFLQKHDRLMSVELASLRLL